MVLTGVPDVLHPHVGAGGERKQKGNLSLYQAVVYLECPLFLRKGAAFIRESGIV